MFMAPKDLPGSSGLPKRLQQCAGLPSNPATQPYSGRLLAEAAPLTLPEFEGGDPKDARERKLGIRTPVHPSRLKHGCETMAGRKSPGRRVRFRDVQKHRPAVGFSR